MNYDPREIEKVLRKDRAPKPGLIALLTYDNQTNIGLAQSGDDGYILILPKQPEADDIEDTFLRFRTWVSLETSDSELLEDVSTVECNYGSDSLSKLGAISCVFSALIQQSIHSLDRSAPGKTIHALRQLFESKFEYYVSEEVEVGLLGELLIVANSPDVSNAISVWHQEASDPYDFSLNDERVEVKVTRSPRRKHRFSSRQIPAPPGVKLVICSMVVPTVAEGVSVSSLFGRISALISNPQTLERFSSTCIQILKCPPQVVSKVQVDESSALRSVVLKSPEEVPTPIAPKGVEYMSWEAVLDEEVGGVESTVLLQRLFSGV